MNVVELNQNEITSISGGISKVNAALIGGTIGAVIGAGLVVPVTSVAALAMPAVGAWYLLPIYATKIAASIAINTALVSTVVVTPAIAGFAVGSVIGE